LPFRVRTARYDPERPASRYFLRTAFSEITAACGLELRPYDLRHHAITKLLEDPKVSDETAESIAGHISAKMKKRYSHTRLAVKMAALRRLERRA
jgi:integrase